MVPPSFLQAPWPLHISVAEANPPSCAKAKPLRYSTGLYDGPVRRFSVIGGGSTILPGFMMPVGSNALLTSAKAWQIRGPNIFSSHGLRTSPSPCSPLMDPPYSSTRSLISSAIDTIRSTPSCRFRSIRGRMCRQPTLAWP